MYHIFICHIIYRYILKIFASCYLFITRLCWILSSDWSITKFYSLWFLNNRLLLWIQFWPKTVEGRIQSYQSAETSLLNFVALIPSAHTRHPVAKTNTPSENTMEGFSNINFNVQFSVNYQAQLARLKKYMCHRRNSNHRICQTKLFHWFKII